MECSGQDSEGRVAYANPGELWRQVQGDKDKSWYAPAIEYWDKQPASYDGVLAGLGHVNGRDIEDSSRFLRKVFRQRLAEAEAGAAQLVAADCGAGVGRVSEQLLLRHFAQVDLVEPSRHLLEAAREKLAGSCPSRAGDGQERRAAFPRGHRAVGFQNLGLQAWTPEAGRYDVIWMQWALLYLTDDDLLALLERCKAGLREGGIVVVKENVCRAGFIVDPEDSSLTRSDAYFLDLIRRAGYTLLGSALQRNFPKGLFQVRMYAARPKAAVAVQRQGI